MAKTPRTNVSAREEKKPRSETPNVRTQSPLWAFRDADIGGPWCWSKMDSVLLVELLQRLGNLETMTWAQIEGATGSHFVGVDNLDRKAKKRLVDLKKDDIAE